MLNILEDTIVEPTKYQYPPFYEYVMPKEMIKDLLEKRDGEEKKMRPHDYLVKVVNDEFLIKGTCLRITYND